MKLKLKHTPEQVELIKAMGSKNKSVSQEAQEAFAAFIGPIVQKVIQQASTAGMIYADAEYDEDDSPSYPLDLYYDEGEGYVNVWSQSMAGGLPTSLVEGVKEMKISTYRLDSAVSFLKKYARKSRLDVVSKALERMSQEVLIKQERNAWAVVLKALASASSTNVAAAGSPTNSHIVQGKEADGLTLENLNSLMVLMRRINASWAGGTAANHDSFGLTDLFVAPEQKAKIRAMAYNPLSTTGVPQGTHALPDGVKEDIYRSAGASEIFGIRITDMTELGVGRKYNKLFEDMAGSLNLANSGTFADGDGDELAIGLDLSKEAFIRAVARQADSGGTFSVLPDDQFVARSDKTGFYGFLEEGRICIDARAIAGIIFADQS
jgi:hypothetical protein